MLQNVEIYHPYGVVGAFQGLGEGVSIPFGATPHPTQLLAISKQIKTFTEGTDESASHIIRIREIMAKSHRLIFLGFAYHKLNMQLLFKEPNGLIPLENRKIYGTALSISDSDVGIITNELAQYTETETINVELKNKLTCAELFKGYWRSMSLN